MTEVLEKLYFMVEDRVGQYELADEETRSLEVRLDALSTFRGGWPVPAQPSCFWGYSTSR